MVSTSLEVVADKLHYLYVLLVWSQMRVCLFVCIFWGVLGISEVIANLPSFELYCMYSTVQSHCVYTTFNACIVHVYYVTLHCIYSARAK